MPWEDCTKDGKIKLGAKTAFSGWEMAESIVSPLFLAGPAAASFVTKEIYIAMY